MASGTAGGRGEGFRAGAGAACEADAAMATAMKRERNGKGIMSFSSWLWKAGENLGGERPSYHRRMVWLVAMRHPVNSCRIRVRSNGLEFL